MKVQKIAVKDKDGVLQVVELGGSGGKRVNGGDLLKEIQIATQSTYVKRREAMLAWEDVEGLTPNTGIAPTEAEKEMFKAEDGTYTLKRIIYDGYIRENQAKGIVGLVIKAIATDETSKVTVYKGDWGKWTNESASQTTYVMNQTSSPFFGPLRDGMDDMKMAVEGTPIDYNAQQRVYIDVERADGSGVDYYVLVIHNAKRYSNNVGLVDAWSGPGPVKAEGTDPAGTSCAYAIWIYPEGVDLSFKWPNAEVILWSNEVQEKIDAGDTGGLTQDQINTVTTYGAVDEWGHAYPLAFRVKVPYCEALQIRMETESPYSAIGFAGPGSHGERGTVTEWTTAIISSPYHGFIPGQTVKLNCGVKTQEQNMVGISGDNRGFTITVEFEVPAATPFMIGSTAKLVLPSSSSNSSPDIITISDGVDVQTITPARYSRIPLNVVLRNCNATYQITVTVGGKTYTGQIVTGPYFGQYTLSEWTEVTEQ